MKNRSAVASLLLYGALQGCGAALPPPPRPPARVLLDPLVARAIDEAAAATPGGSRDARARAHLAMVYHANAMPALAEDAYIQAIERDGGQAKWWYHLALVRALRGSTDDSLAALDVAARLDGSYAPVLWRRGFLLLDSGRLDEARAAFERARDLAPDDAAPQVGLARIHLQQGEAEQAGMLLEPLVQRFQAVEYLRYLLGLARQQQDLLPEAASLLRRAGGRVPRWPDPWEEEVLALRTGYAAIMERADALAGAARFDEALGLLRGLQETFPRDATLEAKIGEVHLHAGQRASARLALERAVAQDPAAIAAHLHLARLFREEGDADRARRHAERALEQHPAFAPAHRELVTLAMAGGDLPGAHAALERMLDAGAGDIDVQVDLATVSYELGRRDEARGVLEQVLLQDPLHDRALIMLARIQGDRGEFEAADRALRQAALVRGTEDPLIRETVRYLHRLRGEGARR